MKNTRNNAVVAGVVGLILGLVLGWIVGNFGAGKSSVKNQNTGEPPMNASGIKLSDALFANPLASRESQSAILVLDQGMGSVATVASVETDVAAWVVVREDNNGFVGNILGASRIDAGDSNNIVVELLRPTETGKTYHVVLFQDNGDKVFDHKVDLPLTSNGVLISKSFKTYSQ